MYVNKRPQSSGQNGTASNLQRSISAEGRLHTRFARQCYKPEHRILHRLPPPKQTSFFSPGRWAALETDAYFAHSYCSQAHTRLMASTTTPIIYFPHFQHLQEFKSVTTYIFRKAPIYTSDNPLQIQLTHISEKHQDPTRNLPVCSPTLTAELILGQNPGSEGRTHQARNNFLSGLWKRLLKRNKCNHQPPLAESISTPR